MNLLHTSEKIIKKQQSFENNLSVNYKKDFGVFLTNNIPTIEEIISIIDFDQNILDKKILEPSCGQGIFLVRLIDKLYSKFKSQAIIEKFINENIIFIDIDPRMIEATKNNLSTCFYHLFKQEYSLDFQGFVYDFTKRLNSKQSDLFFQPIIHPLSKFIGKIDYVIGNPPYVSLYGRRDRKQNEQQRIDILNSYSQFPSSVQNGKINFVMLFLEHGLDFLRTDGALSFIIDISFFETAYKYTRKFLLENTTISMLVYDIKEFDAASGQIILKLKKSIPTKNDVRIKNATTEELITVNQSLWNNSKDEYKFRFSKCAASSKIINKIQNRNLPTLKQLHPKKNLRTCVMLLNMENRFIFEEISREDIKVYPYYQGSRSLKEKYGKFNFSKFFHYDKVLQDAINDELKEQLIKQGIKNKKRLGLGETIIYDHPKIFIRQSAKEIIASYDAQPSASNNSLYVFSLRNNSIETKLFLKFLCGYLNSELITFFAQQRTIIRYSKGKQPQIKIADLYQIPIPTDSKVRTRIAELVAEIYSEGNSNQTEKINQIINDHFNLQEDEISIMRKSISAFL